MRITPPVGLKAGRKTDMNIPERIRAARLAAGMTQAQLAEAIGLDTKWGQSIVARYESGDRPIPRKRLKAVAAVLNLDPLDLI